MSHLALLHMSALSESSWRGVCTDAQDLLEGEVGRAAETAGLLGLAAVVKEDPAASEPRLADFDPSGLATTAEPKDPSGF